MKYLILLIVSLFCLTSYSDHKKTPPITKEEKDRYEELKEKPSFFLDCMLAQEDMLAEEDCSLLKSDEEFKEEEALEEKIYDKNRKLHQHFNKYMRFEMIMNQAQKGDPNDLEKAYFSSLAKLPIRILDLLEPTNNFPDCTKERLEKKQCPKAPYMTIYWAKKYLESGHCVGTASGRLERLINLYTIPKTDIADSEEFFNLLGYIAFYFYEKDLVYGSVSYYKRLEKKAKIELEERKKTDPHLIFDPKKEACIQSEVCRDSKKSREDRIRIFKEKKTKSRKKLSEKQKKIADQMIADLVQKWSKKYGEENIYKCRKEAEEDIFEKFEKEAAALQDFLDKNYPYH